MVSNGSADKNMAQLISNCFSIKGRHIHVPHFSLVVGLGLHTVLLIQAVCYNLNIVNIAKEEQVTGQF